MLIPGLALSWAVDAKDKTRWIFKLRPGVKFHDGSALTADAVVWNVRKVLDKEAPQFDVSQVGVTASRMPTLLSARKIDDLTVELVTSEPDSFLPITPTALAVMGLQLGYLLGGSILIETVFAWPGTGFLLNSAIFQRDLPLLQGTILVLAMFFVVLNLLVDLLQTVLDPRIARTCCTTWLCRRPQSGSAHRSPR